MNKNLINSTNPNKKEKSLAEIFHIIYSRKWILILNLFLALSFAYIYTLFSSPVYESTVILKKETTTRGNNFDDDIMEIFMSQTQDEVETEIELVKTMEVLSKVVNELHLFVQYDKMITNSGEEFILNIPAIEYSNPKLNLNVLPFKLPQIVSIDLKDYDHSTEYYLVKDHEDSFSIYNASNGELINTIKYQIFNSNVVQDSSSNVHIDNLDSLDSLIEMKHFEFSTSLASLNINWTEAPIGSKFYFTLHSFNSALDGLNRQISVKRTGKTNLFTVSVVSSSPFSAAEIVNVLIDKFRESRIEQQKQTIRYTFNFIDEQLQDMQLKLREAEDNLSTFRSNSQITTIDASSQEVVRFLSTLEAEKMNSELQLSDYKNKLEDMKKQLETSGYFDQNLLSIQQSGGSADPFANLLNQISDLELQRLELLQKRTENHPDVVSLDEQISLAKQKLASYNQNTLSAYQILINSLEKKRMDVNNMMSKYEIKLKLLPSQENRFARLLREQTVYEKMFTLLLDKREEMRMAELSRIQDIIVVDPGREPLKPIGPKKLFNLLIAFILGSFTGILVIFVVELKNSNLVNLDEIESDFKIPILSILPKYTRAVRIKIDKAVDTKEKFVNLMTDEQVGFRETYRLLRTKLDLQFEGRRKIFMITSCEEDTGKSTIVANLAISFAQESKRVLIIDFDLRKAGLSSLFDISNERAGLIDYLKNKTEPKIHTRVLKNIDILPAGGVTLDSSNMINTERMEVLFNIIDDSVYDFIIVDTPPVTRVVDTLILGKYFRDAVMVIRPDLTLRENVKAGLQDLAEARIKVRGIIVNAAELSKSYYYKNRYGYGYGYGYGEGNDRSRKENQKVKKMFSPLRKKESLEIK